MGDNIAVTPDKPSDLQAWANQPNIYDRMRAAVGDWMSVDTFMAHAMVTFQEPEVRVCTEGSKCRAIMELAALTLLPTLGQVALVPYRNKGKLEVKVTPQWQGMKALMERHPDILEVSAHLVHTSDDFAILNGDVRHSYDPFDPKRIIDSHSDIRGGYCRITYRDGRPPKFHFVPVRLIAKASRCAQTQKIWSAWYEQMAMKTLYRDCFARRAVPMDPLVYTRLKQAFDIEDLNLGNDPAKVSSEATESHIEQARQQRLATPAEDSPPEDAVIDEPSPESDAQVDPDENDDLEMKIQALACDYSEKMEEARTIEALEELTIEASRQPEFQVKAGKKAQAVIMAGLAEAGKRLRAK